MFELQGDRSSPLKLADFQQTGECYDRKANNNWAVVDAHLHPRPFGGKPVAFSDLMGRLRRAGIFVYHVVWHRPTFAS